MELMNVCPYCSEHVPTFSGSPACPHCGRAIFDVSCPHCSKRTLNLTLIARHGRVVCFSCRSEVTAVPELVAPVTIPVEQPFPAQELMTSTRRAPRPPVLPTAAEARATLEENLVGLERAAGDREMLTAPDLRALIARYLDTISAVLILDDVMQRGEITEEWLRGGDHLNGLIRLCFRPLWPLEGALLPPAVQAWVLIVDDAARRWQFARRQWLFSECGLQLMPIVPGVTTINRTWQEVEGHGAVVQRIITPGFLLHDDIQCKARVQA